MNQIYLLPTILFFSFINLSAQTVTITGSCASFVDGVYTLSSDVNGKPSYTDGDSIIQWTGTRWEHNPIDGTQVGMYNDSDTANPPASSFSPWTPEDCDPAGVFSGDGTSSTLSATDAELSNKNIRLFPNPTTDFIQISGLTKTEKYSISNILGAKIKEGTLSENEKLDIQNLNTGLYLIKFDNGHTLKFRKN
ncbi:T9SS type A sorting domain-containing protein [uncultured Algibacter sp.]|uniref:T9SS type A sorting domain-containing protein n=1 Tax=uncultured Algibacter sp. TaxID=298659 RepID=UPI0026060B30|nr:T9SS type A sorting domain-containing protein [uncultured Algibacter sp.]